MGVLEWIILILLIAWLAGTVFHIAGRVIHILLVLALIVLVVRFLGGGI